MSHLWKIREQVLDLGPRALVMGIVNVTPDSFSDGGMFENADAAIAQGLNLIAQGADLLDIGGESTRPGAAPVPLEEERRRVLPVIRGLAQRTSVPLSIDTSKAILAEEALAGGARIINDVTAGDDPEMARTAARWNAGVVLMHMRGTPATMQDDPHYDDVIGDISAHLQDRVERFAQAGLARENVMLDPGIGFGKAFEHNLEILVRLPELANFGLPICVGVSRKGFIGAITQRPRNDRAVGSAAIACYCLAHRAAHVFRVHDVAEHRDAVRMLAALTQAEEEYRAQ